MDQLTTITRPAFLIVIQPEGKIADICMTEKEAIAFAEQFNRTFEGTKHEGIKRAEVISATATIVADRPIAAAK